MADLTGKTILNRYHINSLLGRGGMGDVYKVWDSNRAVFLALKVLHEDMAEDKVFLRKFSREAETLSALQHPHIVRFYGLEHDKRLTFILMDYVEGTTLRGQIFDTPTPFTAQQVLDIIKPICSALHYAHNMGRVHCDIKPANIMVKSNGDVIVADFGIARLLENATTTTIGQAGTPAYMSPEQARGLKPTPQTDIYSLGIVMYEMLTAGERPFTGEQATIDGSTSEKVRWEHINLKPPSPRKYNPAVSSGLEKVVLKCLDKKPALRYSTVMDLLQAVYVALGNVESINNAEEEERKRIAREKAEREAAEKAAREKAEKEAAERLTQLNRKSDEAIQLECSGYLEDALKIYYDIKSVDSHYPNIDNKIQILEKAILKAKEEEQGRVARKKAEEKARQEKARLIANLLYEKTNQAINFENSGSLDAALKVYSEIQSIDPGYPNIEKKIQEIGNLIELREKAFIEAELLKKEENRRRIAKKITQGIYWLGSFVLIASGIALISSINAPSQTIESTPNDNQNQYLFIATYTETIEPSVTVSPSPTSAFVNTLTPTPLPAEIVDDKGVIMRLVPAGEFTMGINVDIVDEQCRLFYNDCQKSVYTDSEYLHQVKLDAFYIDEFEVTNVLYKACVLAGVCNPPKNIEYYGRSTYDDHPVVYVDWNMAKTYCEWRNTVLPTEAQWEKAARGVDGRIYSWGDKFDCFRANVGGVPDFCVGDLSKVGSYESGKSVYGLYDMTGNVWEWVADWYADDYYLISPASNPTGPYAGNLRVRRGGSWRSFAFDAITATRYFLDPSRYENDTGFRCAKNATP